MIVYANYLSSGVEASVLDDELWGTITQKDSVMEQFKGDSPIPNTETLNFSHA